MKKKQKSLTKKDRPASLTVTSGSPLRMWMDFDAEYEGKNRFEIYATKDEQRSNRPDLVPIPVAVVPLNDYAALEELVAEILANRHGYTVKGEPAMIYRGDAAAVLAALGLRRANQVILESPVCISL